MYKYHVFTNVEAQNAEGTTTAVIGHSRGVVERVELPAHEDERTWHSQVEDALSDAGWRLTDDWQTHNVLAGVSWAPVEAMDHGGQ